MPTEIRPVPIEDLPALVDIATGAYPGMDVAAPEARRQFSERLAGTYDDPQRSLHGLYRDGRLLGIMVQYDFSMNVRGAMIPAGGVGMIAVHLAHKKEKIARDLVLYFLRHYRAAGAPIALLYPFRPDFYRRMGFGHGTKMSQYKYRASALPASDLRSRVRLLQAADAEAILECANRYVAATHGMIVKARRLVDGLFQRPGVTVAGYMEDSCLRGFVVFDFEKGQHFLRNDLRIEELVYESPTALAGLLSFLRSQQDQVEWIIHNTQDEAFHYLLEDPRNDSGRLVSLVYHESNTQGVGLMYRVIDLPMLFSSLTEAEFGDGRLRLCIELADSFLPENQRSTVVEFSDGRATPAGDGRSDVALRLAVAEFSSLVMGVVPLGRLVEYGLAQVDDPTAAASVERLFRTAVLPRCTTRF
jgi:predicted acetyltransferase